ncbi:tetratricopeptide repeat protein [Aquisediminimonas profunda]|uniref:tetratricopeptide repeat protein n=1 Tax=Aquisediminimonas profunda TaxID=1550733 RepID=UPI001C63B724|nr:tetratricopeptide repeat protein [Aquisediminimonas profunda]
MRMNGWSVGAALLLATACSSPQEKAEQAAASANALAAAGDFEAARKAILRAVAARDDQPDQWLLLGRVDLETGRPADALLAYSRVLELDATNIEALQLVAELSFQFGEMREAANAADRVLALDPNATRAILVKGLIALSRKDVAGATSAAETILKLKPQDEFGIVLKARALALGKDYQGAVKIIEDGVPEGQRTEASFATLSELYRVLGNQERLVGNIDKLLARRPKDADLKLDLAEILYKSGNTPRARSTLYALLISQPDNIEVIQKISELWTQNDASALTPAQLKYVTEHGSETVKLAVARYLIDRGRPDVAAQILRPDSNAGDNGISADARALYATALYKQGNADAARSIAEEILSKDKNNIDALMVRARIAMQKQDLTAALNDAQIVVRDFPMSEQGRILLADIYLARKDPQRARQTYEDAVSDNPQSILISRTYAQYLLKTGDAVRATDVARTFTRKSPSSVAGWDLLAKICQQAANNACVAQAQAGRDKAASVYTVDDRPGSLRSRGLFGRL